MSDFDSHSHRRYNPLTRTWVLCSPHSAQRPWLGQRESPPIERQSGYDSSCFLCPGNVRANGDRNPEYASTFHFVNDFSAVRSDQPLLEAFHDTDHDDLFRVESVRGECCVICFSPRHDLTVAEMAHHEVRAIVNHWTASYKAMATKDHVRYVQIFENKGAAMGCSNPLPPCQMGCTENSRRAQQGI